MNGKKKKLEQEPNRSRHLKAGYCYIMAVVIIQYILFFSSGTIKLTKESQKQLPFILKKIKGRLPCEISIIGHSDTKAGSEYNLALSLRRAIHVKNQLLAVGAPRKLLEVSSHGENDPMIPTGDNVAEPKNRRVEIFIR